MEILQNGAKKEQEKVFDSSELKLVNRQNLTLTGIEKVYETNTNKLQVKIAGTNLLVIGENLSVTRLDVSSGIVEVNGIINEMKFFSNNNKGNFFKRIFKWFYFQL